MQALLCTSSSFGSPVGPEESNTSKASSQNFQAAARENEATHRWQEGKFPEEVERRFADAIKHLEANGRCTARVLNVWKAEDRLFDGRLQGSGRRVNKHLQ